MINNIKSKIKKLRYKKDVKKKRKKLFINNHNKSSFKRRRKRSMFKCINFINTHFNKRNLYYFYIVLFIILVFSLIILIIWPFLKVKNINIIKTDSITNIDIAYRSTERIRWKHILLIKDSEIKQNIRDFQENIKDIEIDIQLLDSINIKLWSYKPLFDTKINNKNYAITENGALISVKDSKELSNIHLINKNHKNVIIPDYKKILEEKHVRNIKKINDELKNNLITINIKDIYYYILERELIIILDNDNKIIFDLHWDIDSQIKKLVIFNKEHFEVNKKKLVYIDLRIKNKIFFCNLTEEYQCIMNLKKIYDL